jgi:hypothetical protein
MLFNDYQYKKKIDRVSVGFDRVDLLGRPGFPGPIPKRVVASTRVSQLPGQPAGPVRVLKLWYN